MVHHYDNPLPYNPVPCFCLKSVEPEEKEPGCHHATTCKSYRSSTVGPDAAIYESKFRELCRIRRVRRETVVDFEIPVSEEVYQRLSLAIMSQKAVRLEVRSVESGRSVVLLQRHL